MQDKDIKKRIQALLISVKISHMGELEPLFNSSTDHGLSENCQEALRQLEEHVHQNHSKACCGKIRLIPHARNAVIKEQYIYSASLCTLVEQRWSTKRSLPDTGNEPCPDKPVGDIWEDYQFDAPKTTVLNPPELSIRQDLDQTRRREECVQCQTNKQNPCPECKGRRSIVTWIQLNIKWLNHSSSLLFSSDNQSFSSQSIIQTATNKTKVLDFDDIWPSNKNSLDHILDTCQDLPRGLRNELNNKFSEHQKSDKILRLQCIIEGLYIQKIDYQLNGLPSKKINRKNSCYFFYFR
jgi:hypothetical protein